MVYGLPLYSRFILLVLGDVCSRKAPRVIRRDDPVTKQKRIFREKLSREAILCNLHTIVCSCALLWPFWAPLEGELSSQNEDKRRQSWTIVDKFLKPPFAMPPFRLGENSERKTPKKDSDGCFVLFFGCYFGCRSGGR